MDTSDEWIRTRTGIAQRYVISTGESLVEIAAQGCNGDAFSGTVGEPVPEANGTTSGQYDFSGDSGLISGEGGAGDAGIRAIEGKDSVPGGARAMGCRESIAS